MQGVIPPEMTCGFLTQLVFCINISLRHQSVTPFFSGVPPPKKNLDPLLFPANRASNQSQGKEASASGEFFSVYALTNVFRGKTLSDCKTAFFLSYIVVLLVYRYFSYHKTSTNA